MSYEKVLHVNKKPDATQKGIHVEKVFMQTDIAQRKYFFGENTVNFLWNSTL